MLALLPPTGCPTTIARLYTVHKSSINSICCKKVLGSWLSALQLQPAPAPYWQLAASSSLQLSPCAASLRHTSSPVHPTTSSPCKWFPWWLLWQHTPQPTTCQQLTFSLLFLCCMLHIFSSVGSHHLSVALCPQSAHYYTLGYSQQNNQSYAIWPIWWLYGGRRALFLFFISHPQLNLQNKFSTDL
jgi:hypothetical protein